MVREREIGCVCVWVYVVCVCECAEKGMQTFLPLDVCVSQRESVCVCAYV